jgi:predicted 2-oxoglutarate/Fe(II)-dependent dioxygenase YbiX
VVHHPLPSDMGFCAVIPEFLSPAQCQALIDRGEANGFRSANTDYPPSYRNNERWVVDDAALARTMGERLSAQWQLAGLGQQHGESIGGWRFDSVNERFRFCRYQADQAFHIHQDGVHQRGPMFQSRLTFMIYLTDGDDFEGGDTLFFAGGPGTAVDGQSQPPVVARVRPRRGSLILFEHHLWHAGATVTKGIKHIVRSDVMFRRETPASLPNLRLNTAFTPSHEGYVWSLCRAGHNLVASGGRDAVIRLWTEEGADAGCLRGHSQSVLGLASADDGRLVSVSRDRTLRVWDLTLRCCDALLHPHEGAILCVHAWQGHVVSGAADGTIALSHPNASATQILARGLGWVWDFDSAEDGLLVAALESGEAVAWRADQQRQPWTLKVDAPLRAVAISRDAQQLVVGDVMGRIHHWVRQDSAWQLAHCWQAHRAALRCLRFAPDASLYSAAEDGCVRHWSGTHQCLWQHAHDNFVTDLLPLSNSALLSCAYDGRILRHRP